MNGKYALSFHDGSNLPSKCTSLSIYSTHRLFVPNSWLLPIDFFLLQAIVNVDTFVYMLCSLFSSAVHKVYSLIY